MLNSIYMVLALLYIKHWLIDFVNQNAEELANKGRYGNAHGLMHSIKHGVATFLVFWYMLNWQGAVILGFIDFVIHYHVDWAKAKINTAGQFTADNPKFWLWLGADQLAHHVTYLFLVYLAI